MIKKHGCIQNISGESAFCSLHIKRKGKVAKQMGKAKWRSRPHFWNEMKTYLSWEKWQLRSRKVLQLSPMDLN